MRTNAKTPQPSPPPPSVKNKFKRRLAVCLVVLVSGFVALNAIAYRHAYAMMHFKRGVDRTDTPEKLTLGQKVAVLFCGVRLPRPASNLPPSSLGPNARDITIPVSKGMSLGAWYSPGANSSPLVLLFHGYAGDKSGTLEEGRLLLDMGYSVMLVDFRGSGESTESDTTIGFLEAEDVAAAVRYARERLPHPKLILYGISMGSAAVLRSVHSCGVRPDAIVVEAVFDKLLNTVRHRFEAMGVPAFPCAQLLVFWGGRQAGFNAFAHNPVDYATRVECPILFLHGSADPRAHLEEAQRVFAAVPGQKQFKAFPELGHTPSAVRYPQAWKEAVGQFLRENKLGP